MRTRCNSFPFDPINQEPVRLNVSLPVTFPDPPQRMIEVPCGQWLLQDQ